MKCVTRDQCVQRYGHIDFGARYWPDQTYWLSQLHVPAGWFPAWTVMDTRQPVKMIACNLDMKGPLYSALESLHNKNLGHLLSTYDGCFNIRMVRGSNDHFSAHSYGLAIDLNASTNQLGHTSGGFYQYPELVKCFTDQGFSWGGNFHGRKDPMHLSYCWE